MDQFLMTLADIVVHYFNSSARFAAQARPPLCRKCGSHRTEVVGRSPDEQVEKIIIIRCAACGERSEVPADTDAFVSSR